MLFAQTTQDVVDAVRICTQHRLPIIPFGAGTSLEGQVSAPFGGLAINLGRMNQILRVAPEDFDCTVEPGVTHRQLNHYLRDTGLFFPVDPGADATIGGMVATRASGTNAVRYGTMRESVLSLTVVLANGEVIKTANRARKSAAGYDLTHLLVGSEGTLGIITEVTLRLHGIPATISSAVCAFPDIGAAVKAVIGTIQAGIPIARIELLDETQIEACNRYSHLALEVAPTLFLEFHGSPVEVQEQTGFVAAVVEEHGGSGFRWANDPDERARLWTARHNAYYALLALRAGSTGWATDVCVPISKLAECIMATREDLARTSVPSTIVGHVGDGNFHVCFAVDPSRPQELDEVQRINDAIVARALSMEGTCTGEHGIGTGKMQYLIDEHGPAGVQAMRAIKRALDPLNLLNPGKILTFDPTSARLAEDDS